MCSRVCRYTYAFRNAPWSSSAGCWGEHGPGLAAHTHQLVSLAGHFPSLGLHCLLCKWRWSSKTAGAVGDLLRCSTVELLAWPFGGLGRSWLPYSHLLTRSNHRRPLKVNTSSFQIWPSPQWLLGERGMRGGSSVTGQGRKVIWKGSEPSPVLGP